MYCKKCGNDLNDEVKFCDKCGEATGHLESKDSTQTIPKKSKKILASVISVLTFIIIIVVVRWITSEGISGIFNKSNQNKTEQKITDYFSNNSTWKEFVSPVGHFGAEFPTYPKHETQNLKVPNSQLTLKYDTYSSELSDGTAFIIGTTTYSSEIDTSNPEVNLEGALNGVLASNDANKLVSSNLTYFGSHKAIDFLILNGTIYMKGKIILVGQTLYELLVAYENKNYNENDFNRFVNSFVLQ